MNTRRFLPMVWLILALPGLITVAACTDTGKDDPVIRGEEIHKVCLPCHNTTLYVSSQRKITSLPELREEVTRWGDYYNPALSEQDVEDVTAYLNAKFYNF